MTDNNISQKILDETRQIKSNLPGCSIFLLVLFSFIQTCTVCEIHDDVRAIKQSK
jgi:hypothetical protein